jgi:hypothetical protein
MMMMAHQINLERNFKSEISQARKENGITIIHFDFVGNRKCQWAYNGKMVRM